MGMAKSNGTIRSKKMTVPCKNSEGEIVNTECFAAPPSTVEEVISESLRVESPGSILDNTPAVANTVAALNTTTESSELATAIAAYSAYGSNITVTFYHALNSDAQQRSWQTDFSESLDNVHYSYLKILNFQMKLAESLSFSYTTEDVRSQLIGTAILYPHFCPNQGDLFIYEVQPGLKGLFRIYEAPERMSIRSSTVHQIKFILMAYLTSEQIEKLDACVETVNVFNIGRYLNDDGALLTTGEYATLGELEQALSTLLNAYNSEFYDTTLFNTFIDSACLYDPYVVEFLTKIVPLNKMPGYPTQLKSNPINWKRSFWFKLLDPSMVPDEILISKCFKVLQEVTYRTAGTNALANRCYIALMKDGAHPYPPFRIPTTYDKEVQTIPMQVRLYFDTGKVRPKILIDLASKILSGSRRAQFYYMPILIFLLQKSIDALQNGTDIVYNEDKQPTNNDDCLMDCVNCMYSCNPLELKQKLCKGAVHCECHSEFIPDDGGTLADGCDCGCDECDIVESHLGTC